MSQLPPGDPFGHTPPAPPSARQPPGRPVPYSALAIAAFVCSLLGCLGFTAVLGLILGIAGVVVTRDGARRGMGLAIAAIPISLVTGLLSVVMILLLTAVASMMQVVEALPDVYDDDGNVSPKAVAVVRKAFSEELKYKVSEEQFITWLEQVRAEHGAIVQITDVGDPAPAQGNSNRVVIKATGKFTSGPQEIVMTLQVDSPVSFRVADISIGGLSPRSLE